MRKLLDGEEFAQQALCPLQQKLLLSMSSLVGAFVLVKIVRNDFPSFG